MSITADAYSAATGTHKFTARNAAGAWWRTDTSVFETYNAANIAVYGITATSTGGGWYQGTLPDLTVTIGLRLLAGASLATTDPTVWTDTTALPRAAAGASGGLATIDSSLRVASNLQAIAGSTTSVSTLATNAASTNTRVILSLPAFAPNVSGGLGTLSASITGGLGIPVAADNVWSYQPDIDSPTALARITHLDADISSRMATFTYTTPPTAAANASAVRTNLSPELARIDVAVSTAGGGGTGNGDIAVDHDYGGTDAYRFTLADGTTGVDDALVTAFINGTADAQTRTGSDGRFVAPLMLDAGTYTLVYSARGMVTQSIEVEVA